MKVFVNAWEASELARRLPDDFERGFSEDNRAYIVVRDLRPEDNAAYRELMKIRTDAIKGAGI